MGRRRSGPLTLAKKVTQVYKQRKARRLKPPFTCPWCNEDACIIIIRKPVLFIGCTRCKKGEVMPIHPTHKPIDYYCILCDSVNQKDAPKHKFRFVHMTEKQLNSLRQRVTLGEISVEVVDDE